MDKSRVAILGGGPAALATAFELSDTPELRDRYQIDLYQIGWRLGGKCASSRNRAMRGRNEEHGLHVLGGFYHNVFSQLRPLYEEWGQVSPLAITFDDAFNPQSTFTLMQRDDEGWRAVSVDVPRNAKILGKAPETVTLCEALNRLVSWLAVAVRQLVKGEAPALWLKPVQGWDAPPARPQLAGLAEKVEALVGTLCALPGERHTNVHLDQILAHVGEVQSALGRLGENAPPRGPDWLGVVELIAAIAGGLAADRIAERGFDCINGLDAVAWLQRHGASRRAVTCPLLQAGYHYAFAFEGGDWTRPNIAAGVAMRGLLRMVFGFHDAVLMHMEGGMGEIFVTPYFEVLRARGVRFHFFHRVEDLVPGDDGRLAEIRMRLQARPANGSGVYEPLVDHDPGDGGRHRRCWPEAPLYEQLADSEAVREAGNLEKWIDSAGFGSPLTLRAGADFDLCVLAISVGVLRETTTALAAANPAWAAMLASAGVTPTIAAQIWRRETVAHFHGVSEDGLMTGFAAPLDTWGNLSFLTRLEQPDASGNRPASLSYFCGPITASSEPGSRARPQSETEAWLRADAAGIFPGLRDSAGGYNAEGEIERYSRINDDPAELYVCSPAGSIDKRLGVDKSGFAGLMLAGDWTANNFDCGAVETAVLSAKLCARAISGSPATIFGESDFT